MDMQFEDHISTYSHRFGYAKQNQDIINLSCLWNMHILDTLLILMELKICCYDCDRGSLVFDWALFEQVSK